MNTEEKTNDHKRKNDGMTSGLILIAVGIIFLVMQFGGFHINNWWALFILIPVVTAWNRAIKTSAENGKITEESIQSITGSLFPLFVAAIFLFNWDWGQVWPGFIILAGINALGRAWGRN